MGIRSAMMSNPVEVARDAIEADGPRRAEAQTARRVYEDDGEQVTRNDLDRYINDRTRKDRIGSFAHLAQCNNLVKRIIDDKVSPVYAQSPTRRTDPASAEATLAALCNETRLDAKHDKMLRLTEAQGAAVEFFRYVPRLESVVVDVIPAESAFVVPDPDDPLRELAVGYAKPVTRRDGNASVTMNHWVVWDDEQAFTLDENFRQIPMMGADGKFALTINARNGHPGILPFVVTHSTERAGRYWNATAGRSFVATHKAITFLMASALRLVKVQGHIEKVLTGDPSTFPKNQTLDPEQLLIAGEGNSISVVSNSADPGHFLRVAEAITLAVGANHGLNRELLNAQVKTEMDSVALLEHRQQIVKRAGWLEVQAFEKLKVVSQAHDDPTKRLPSEAKLSIDFAEYTHRVDRKAQLEIWDMEVKKGIRSVYDIIRSDNPEINSDEGAKAEIERNVESYKWLVDTLRAGNISLNAEAGQPGQDARANGAMGPAVRDGEISKDQASEAARTGEPVIPDK